MGRLDWDDLASLVFGVATAVGLIGSYAVGLWARRFLPARHQTHESLEIVHAIIGMLVAMIAILLGLQLDSATKAFDDVEQLSVRSSIQAVQLDSLLREYGPGAAPARSELAAYVAAVTHSLEMGNLGDHEAQGTMLRKIGLSVLQLTPTSAMQSRLQSDASSLLNGLFQERWQFIAGARVSPHVSLYCVLIVWLVLVYGAFGLNAPFNVPVFLVLTCSALAVGGAVFVLADMQTPVGGLISISPQSMQDALARIRQ